MDDRVTIIAFYEFKDLPRVAPLAELKSALKETLRALEVRGTIILADEGFNGMICGTGDKVAAFVESAGRILDTTLHLKTSFHEKAPFRKIDVKIKPEIVTLKQPVDMALGAGTHVEPNEWNEIISAPDVIVLDTRNDYEFQTGSFAGALNPKTAKFSDLPDFVAENLDPSKHKRVAMYCTGGIRCEKFAPYLKQAGFEEVYQLHGGILKYLEEVAPAETLWRGECFVFDERITVDEHLRKGSTPDYSQRHDNAKKPTYKAADTE
jgi:UPF0176 protein